MKGRLFLPGMAALATLVIGLAGCDAFPVANPRIVVRVTDSVSGRLFWRECIPSGYELEGKPKFTVNETEAMVVLRFVRKGEQADK